MYQNIYVDKFNQRVHLWDDQEGYIQVPLRQHNYGYTKDPRGNKKAIDGKTVRKIKLNKQIREDARDPSKQHLYYETDVPIETRVLIDRYGDSDEPSTGHRELNFDIETEILQGFPDWKNPINKITAIAWHEKLTDQYGVLVLDEEKKVKTSVEGNKTVISCQSEAELLHCFLEQYEQLEPHILTGWNIEMFDIPYLVCRIKRVLGDGEANRLSPVGQINYREMIDKWFIEGVALLDYMLLYKKFTMGERSSYRLDAIGKHEVDLGKIEYEGNLDDLFQSDINKYIEYNLNDVEIVKRLDEKLKFIDLAKAICHKGHIPYQKIHITSAYLDGAILTHTHRLGIVTKNVTRGVTKDSKFTGAYVKVPNPGRYDWIYDLDLTSLYPSIIMSLNMSPETKMGKIIDFDVEDFKKRIDRSWTIETDKEQLHLQTEDLIKYLTDTKYSISSNGVLYKTDRAGLIPSILDRWFNERVEYKNLRKKFEKEGDDVKVAYFDQMQYTTKILLNSMYGVLGSPSFRFFDIDNAEGVTTTGQQLIKSTGDFGSKFYNDELGTKDKDYCIYTDTDSVFFSAKPIIEKRFPDIDMNDNTIMAKAILPVADEVQTYINKMYDLYAKRIHNLDSHRFDIKQELISRAGIWIAKKRYAQWVINQEGYPVNKIDVKGIDVVRSNYPAAFRIFLGKVLRAILEGETRGQVDDKIIEFRDSIKDRPLIDIAKSTGVKNIEKYTKNFTSDKPFISSKKGVPAHVKASVNYNDLIVYFKQQHKGKIRSGDKIKWVYLKNNPYGIESCALKGYDDPKQIVDFVEQYVNYEKIFKSDLQNKLDAFYGAMKWGGLPQKNAKLINKFFEF